MKKTTNQLPHESYAEMHAKQAIMLITKWIEERYPKISAQTKSRLITQCLIEVREERRNQHYLN